MIAPIVTATAVKMMIGHAWEPVLTAVEKAKYLLQSFGIGIGMKAYNLQSTKLLRELPQSYGKRIKTNLIQNTKKSGKKN